jgi:SAM-dependent methyltransferase
MSELSDQKWGQFYADTYDEAVPDWPGEMDFWRSYADGIRAKGERLLDVACGTGRIGIRLAQEGAAVTGLDLSQKMLDVAKQKSAGIPGMHWVQSDMCSFDLAEEFGLAIIGGHAFMNLNTVEQQLGCLQSIRRHLEPGGRLIVHLDHQDLGWLGDLMGEKGGVLELDKEFTHPRTGHRIRQSQAWRYEPATQTNVSVMLWEEVDDNGRVLDSLQSEPQRFHCMFRYEMEHLLVRAGYQVEALYGDFFRHGLEDRSPSMIWVARNG